MENRFVSLEFPPLEREPLGPGQGRDSGGSLGRDPPSPSGPRTHLLNSTRIARSSVAAASLLHSAPSNRLCDSGPRRQGPSVEGCGARTWLEAPFWKASGVTQLQQHLQFLPAPALHLCAFDMGLRRQPPSPHVKGCGQVPRPVVSVKLTFIHYTLAHTVLQCLERFYYCTRRTPVQEK